MNNDILAQYVLSDREREVVESVIKENVPQYSFQNYSDFCIGCRKAADQLPDSIITWRNDVLTKKAGVLGNLPIDEKLPDTPTTRGILDHTPLFADSVIGTISVLFGTLYTFEGKTTNRHIHNIYPIFGDEYTQLGSSKVALEWHVEDGFHPERPDWVGLFCLRGDTKAETRIARAKDLMLQVDYVEEARNHIFKLRIDDSFNTETHSTYIPTYIISGAKDDPEIVFDPAYTLVEDDKDVLILNAVSKSADEVQCSVTLSSGELLFFDNRRVIHGRTSYNPKMDGQDRWLKRVLITSKAQLIGKLNNGTIPLMF